MSTTNTTTTKAPRITKANRFEDIKALLNGEPVKYGTTVEEARAFCDSELALLSRKNSGEKKQSQTQKDNEGFKPLIENFLLGQSEPVSCTTVQRGIPEFAEFNNQKVAGLLKLMIIDGKVIKTKKGSQSMFALA